MVLSQKEVFYALAKNHGTNARALCVKVGVSYGALVKRLAHNKMSTLNFVELTKLCAGLDISRVDLLDLMEKTERGEFDDGYPREKFKLGVSGSLFADKRTVLQMLTPEEWEIIQVMRESEKKTTEAITQHVLRTQASG